MKYPSIILCAALFGMCSLSNCASDSSTDQEISQAQAAVAAAEFALDITEMAYTAKMADPSTDPLTRMAAGKAMDTARTRVAEEKAKLAAIQKRRQEAAILAATGTAGGTPTLGPSNPLLPPPGAGL